MQKINPITKMWKKKVILRNRDLGRSSESLNSQLIQHSLSTLYIIG